MDYEQSEERIAALIDAAEAEQGRVREAITDLEAVGKALQQEVRSAAASSMREALKDLQADIDLARGVVRDLQRVSLWRAAWQHLWMALVAIGMTLLAVWWYVPTVSQMNALRAERQQMQASIEELNSQGARMQHSMCGAAGEKKRFCVLVPKKNSFWESSQNPAEAYVVPIGY